MEACEIDPDSPAHGRLERVLAASDRMTGLVDALLGYASIDHRPPDPVLVEIPGIVDDLLVELEASVTATDAEVTVGIEPGTTCFADEIGIRQVLTNLVQNAIKYSDGAPQIRISTRELEGGITVGFADRGIGFGQALVAQAFVPFQCLHDMSISGNGVGLAICRRIVERMCGRLWALSEIGEGSTLSVWLPGEGEVVAP